MSTASKVTLALTSLGTLAVIYSVHRTQVRQSYLISSPHDHLHCTAQTPTSFIFQVEDRAKLHDGIVRDLERQAKKKVVNQQLLVQQQELAKLYRKAEEKER